MEERLVRPAFIAVLLVVLIGAICSFTYWMLIYEDDAPKDFPDIHRPFDPDVYWQSERQPVRRLPPSAPCAPILFSFDGHPQKYRSDILGVYRVPKGRMWTITNVSLMAERHSGGPHAVAGEWTVQLAAGHDATASTVAVSSLDNGSGIALQGQGAVKVVLDEGDSLTFSLWLRPGTHRPNYYYTIGTSGIDCPEPKRFKG